MHLADTTMIQFSASNNLRTYAYSILILEIRVELSYLLDLEVKSRMVRDRDPPPAPAGLAMPSKPAVETCDMCAPKWTSSRVFLIRSVLQICPASWQPETGAPVHAA